MRDAVIVACGRSAIGRAPGGSLKYTRPEEIGSQVLKAVLEKAGALKEEIDDVILGCAMPEGEQGINVARLIAAKAGLSYKIPAQTVNRFCSSGLQSIASAANGIMAEQYETVVAGGLESMSCIPMGGFRYVPDPKLIEEQPENYLSMGHTAERVAQKYQISRQEQDEFSVQSHLKAAKAQAEGKFDEQIIKINMTLADGKTQAVFATDEGIRANSSLEALGKLKPVFTNQGTVTAGNSSQMSDGAAYTLLTSREKAEKFGLKPLARFVSFAVAGVPAELMGIGPIEAIPKALRLAGLTLADIDLIELNEAFASQSIACIRTLSLPMEKVNVNGGAIALGHPLGCTGAALTTKLIYELKARKGRYGLVSMCIGGGQGAAGIFEVL